MMPEISSKSAFTADVRKISVTPVLERNRRIFEILAVWRMDAWQNFVDLR
jgi:hypothetical protein